MKQRFYLYCFFTFTFLFLPFAFLLADTIIDSVYSDPYLDGYIKFSQNAQGYSVNNWMYNIAVGDTGIDPFLQEPNSYFRGFLSFDLPEIPEHYYLDSCYVRLYQFYCAGQDLENHFPVWNVAGGDTIKCILSHIDYGAELDPGDWEKGDEGNQYTFQNNVGTVTEDWHDGYRYINVTECVLYDYHIGRTRSQYRIAFQIDTDWDDLADVVDFITSNSQAEFARPQLFFHLSDEPTSNGTELVTMDINLHNHPNPFNPCTTISFNLPEDCSEQIELSIYNLKGQKVKSFQNLEITQSSNHEIIWDGTDHASGVYYCKLTNVETRKLLAVQKITLLK